MHLLKVYTICKMMANQIVIILQLKTSRINHSKLFPILYLFMNKQQYISILALISILCVPTHTQFCSLGTSSSNSDLLQSGNSLIYNSYINTPARRQHSFTFTVSFNAPSGIQVAASASSLQVSTGNGMDFAIWGGQGASSSSGLIVLLINDDNSWNSIKVHYLASGRSQFFLGSFSAGIYLLQKQSQSNAISFNQAIPAWTASQKSYNIIAQLSGVKVGASTFVLSLTGVSFNGITGTISTTISLSSSPFIESIVITYIIFQKLSPITFSPFTVLSGSSSPYQFIGIDQFLSGSTTLAGYAFNSAVSGTGVTCVGDGCPAACITAQICQTYSGTLNGGTCLVCGASQVPFNGQCIAPNNCGTNQYYNGISCVCNNNYIMVSNVCYVSCGANALVNNSQCSCIPGYTYSSTLNQCVVQSSIICGPNFVTINNKCVCPSSFGIINNQCVLCSFNSYVDQNGNCVCRPGFSLNPNSNTCQIACFTNAYRNSLGQCVCINGFYNQGNLCIPQGNCQNGYIWNGTNCACQTGMVVDSITNACTYCNTPDRAVSNGKCGCSPTYYPTSTGCSPCIPNSVYNAAAQTCLCITNYSMSNGKCQQSANCPFSSYWNAALNQCTCNFTGQYVINGYCQICTQNSTWNGSACACNPGYVPSNGLCIQNCTGNTFWNGFTCQCNPGYYIITGTCQLCDFNSVYSNTQLTCVCKDGYFGTWNQCSRCDSSCARCSGPGSNQCLTCPSGSSFTSGYCKIVCSAGTYINNLNQCTPCDSSCATCSGPGNNLCSSCGTGFTLTNGYCKANTPVVPVVPGVTSAISLKGYTLGSGKIYQGVALNLMPTAILTAGCTVCDNLFSITVNSQFAAITTSQQFITNTLYWFIIIFDFTGASSVPTFQYTVKINPTQASYFTSADMSQVLTGSFKQGLFNAAKVLTPSLSSVPSVTSFQSSSQDNSNNQKGIYTQIIKSIFGQGTTSSATKKNTNNNGKEKKGK